MLKRASDAPDAKRALSLLDKLQVILVCIFSPLFGGLIFYYGWKEKLPMMAKQAGKIAIVITLCEIVLGIALGYVIYFTKTS